MNATGSAFIRNETVSFAIDTRYLADRMREVVRDEPKAFAYGTGISLSAVYNYMNGRVPTTDVLFRIAKYTRRPMEWFLDPEFEEEPTKTKVSNGHESNMERFPFSSSDRPTLVQSDSQGRQYWETQ
ncbi:MAG: helix-turn-helix transcriptional regulator [bacterium]|nr:helix-turn-helix transcriptional regulator [bacterium]